MSISALGSSTAPMTPVSLPQENEAAERVPDNEATEVSRASSLKEGTGTKIDVSA